MAECPECSGAGQLEEKMVAENRRFSSERPPGYDEAVNNLISLGGLAGRAAAEALCHLRTKNTWGKRIERDKNDVPRWLKTGRSTARYIRPPGSDHDSFWIADGRRTFVTEPYNLSSSDVLEMVRFADMHGLEFHIDPACSSWFPGRTMAVIWTATPPPRQPG